MSQWLDRIKYGSGKNGSPTVSGVINSYATCTGNATELSLATTLSASAGDVILIHQTFGAGAGQWEINYVLADAGATLTLAYPLAYDYVTGAQCVLIPQYVGGTLSGAVSCTSWNGSIGGIIALMSNGNLTISGSLSVQEQFLSYDADASSSNLNGKQGDGSAGLGNTRSTSANGNGGGGGGYGPNDNQKSGGAGAGGGHANNGSGGSNTVSAVNGSVGNSVGSADLINMNFGGAGGSGGPSGAGGGQAGIRGGKGGGIILIISKNFTLSGNLYADGGSAPTPGDNKQGSGGGGAGGSVLIKTQNAVLGTNKITVSGGNGASSTYSTGGNGSVGRIRCDYFSSISGSSSPTISSAQNSALGSQVYGAMI